MDDKEEDKLMDTAAAGLRFVGANFEGKKCRENHKLTHR